MKILLDENLPAKIKHDFNSEHEVYTVYEMGWNSKKNGELLGLMIMHGFDDLVTIDKNLQYQQNIDKFKIKIIILDAFNNKLETLRPFVNKLLQVLRHDKDGQILIISL